jgi:ribosomal protein S18 acetylase RimI-like enzyme
MHGEPLRPDDIDAVVHMIAAEQVQPDRNIAYLGTDAAGIRAELDALEPDWTTTARIVRSADGSIAGAVVVELDREQERAWVFGPWVAGDDWDTLAPHLFDAALVQLPETVGDAECSGLVENTRLQSLAESRGWRRSGVHHALTVGRAAVAEWPEVSGRLRLATPADLPAIRALHDAEFPGTHTPADRLLDERTVLVAIDRALVVGYVAGLVHPDGEGYIDYVAVDPADRGNGLGRRLVMALTAALMDASPLDVVALTVDDDRAPARALYASLGFATAASFVAYRS